MGLQRGRGMHNIKSKEEKEGPRRGAYTNNGFDEAGNCMRYTEMKIIDKITLHAVASDRRKKC